MTRQGKLLIALGIAVALYAFARSEKGSTLVTDILSNASRGIRNNNPLNIRLSQTTWQGQVPAAAQTDKEFIQFTDPIYGIRAGARILKQYAGRGLITIEKIVSTWAPPSENDTAAYAASVSKISGFAVNQPLTLAQMFQLIPAMITQENGRQPYTPGQIATGVSLA